MVYIFTFIEHTLKTSLGYYLILIVIVLFSYKRNRQLATQSYKDSNYYCYY